MCNFLCKLCASVFKLAFTLKKYKDMTYKCERAVTGNGINEESMEPQKSEAIGNGRKRRLDMRVAYDRGGCLYKVLEVGSVERKELVLENDHVVTTDEML